MSTHLAETSVLTRYWRPEVATALATFEGSLARCTITDLELGFSASNASEWDERQALIARLEPIEVTPQVMNRAKIVQRWLADRGLKGRGIRDVIIAAAAELANLTLLHYDHDFELIASLTGQSAAWIVPRGSID